jgi:hypothetical protein
MSNPMVKASPKSTPIAPEASLAGRSRAQRAKTALAKTLARLEEVAAVLWLPTDHHANIVTILEDCRDEAMLLVAQEELRLMDEMEDWEFDFSMARKEDMKAFLASGYVPIFEKPGDDNA